MELPEGLAPWSLQLGALPRAVALGLGPWLARLEALLGPLRAQREQRQGGAPDGYRGVTRRGPYERLLLSEWALADAEPDEFLRRAATGEHHFFELERAQRSAGQRCVALFDLSPWQMGAPRVAHAALLVALDRRARQHGVPMLWGVVQDGACALLPGSPAALHLLLQRRVQCGDALQGLAHWSEGLPAPGEPHATLHPEDELWWIGGPALLEAAPWPMLRARVLIQPCEVDAAPGLEVALHPQRGRSQSLRLPLPAEDLCLRLLRGERAQPSPKPQSGLQVDPTGGLLFSPDGRRLLVRHPSGDAMALHLPNSPQEPTGHIRWLRVAPGERLLAVGWHKKRFLALRQEEGGLFLDGVLLDTFGQRLRWDVSALLSLGFVPQRPEQPLGFCLSLEAQGATQHVMVLDADRKIFQIAVAAGQAPTCRRVTDNPVESCVPAGERRSYYCYSQRPRGSTQPRMEMFTSADPSTPVVSEEGAFSLIMGHGYNFSQRRPGSWACRLGALEWRAQGSKEAHQIMVPSGSVVGVTCVIGSSVDASLVVLDEDRRQLRLLLHSGERPLCKSEEPLVLVAVSACARSMVASLTQSGELLIHECSDGYGLLTRYFPKEEEA